MDLEGLNHLERVAFFLNVYQCMYIHYYLKQTNENRNNNLNNTNTGDEREPSKQFSGAQMLMNVLTQVSSLVLSYSYK